MNDRQGTWAAVAATLMMLAMAVVAPAQTFTTLANFDETNGSYPYYEPLVQGFDGNLYGTTFNGGNDITDCSSGCGTIFSVSTTGALTTITNISGTYGPGPGVSPVGGLALNIDGNFYGTTSYGSSFDAGTVFKVTPSGQLTTLLTFNDGGDGANPWAQLIRATDGSFYGTTEAGGTYYIGTVFKVTPKGTLTTLHIFSGPDGSYPAGALIEATDGSFYGTTLTGGTNNGGTVFKLASNGTLTTLYNFCSQANCVDGYVPFDGLVQSGDGNFYGTTQAGGTTGNGTVFKITPTGTLTTLYSFCSQANCADGNGPLAGLVIGSDRNFYGTTEAGGGGGVNCQPSGCGTIFEITPGGVLTTLHSFDGTDGSFVGSRLVQATDGNFYGTTNEGGTSSNCNPMFSGCGTVFSLAVGLGPFVETVPTSGKVGAGVIILGNNLTGSTRVTFNGKRAAFKVVSNSEITTTVSTGATTGKVKVTTPHGTLSSNVSFRVP